VTNRYICKYILCLLYNTQSGTQNFGLFQIIFSVQVVFLAIGWRRTHPCYSNVPRKGIFYKLVKNADDQEKENVQTILLVLDLLSLLLRKFWLWFSTKVTHAKFEGSVPWSASQKEQQWWIHLHPDHQLILIGINRLANIEGAQSGWTTKEKKESSVRCESCL
jgi:hypothetical protein